MMSPLAKSIAKPKSPTSLNSSISSPRRRNSIVTNSSSLKEKTNDDSGEKLAMLKNNVVAPHKSSAKSVDEYNRCLQLFHENKITVKNAFQLSFFDYMSDVLINGEKTDFKLAAYSLETGAKIYSCRVDGIHAKVFKCINSLSIKGAVEWEEDEVPDAGDDDAHVENDENKEVSAKKAKEEKLKKRKKKKVVLSQNDTKSISLDINSFNRQIDPLFDKFMHGDMSCSESYLQSSLIPLNDSQSLVFACDDPLPMFSTDELGIVPDCLPACKLLESIPEEEKDMEIDGGVGEKVVKKTEHHIACVVPYFKNNKKINIDRYRVVMRKCFDDNKLMCKDFRNFQFNHNTYDFSKELSFSKLRYDSSSSIADNEDIASLGGFDDNNDNDMSLEPQRNNSSLQENINIPAVLSFNHELNRTITSMKDGDLSKLKEAILLDESGFTGINEEFLRIWSHPNLWKAKSSRINSKKEAKTKKPKVVTMVDFVEAAKEEEEEEVKKAKGKKKAKVKHEVGSVEWHFEATRKTRCVLEKHAQLPEAFTTFMSSFYRPYNFNDIKIESKSASKDLDVPGYDFDNDNDKLNYCPAAPQNDNYDDDDDNVGGFDGADMNATLKNDDALLDDEEDEEQENMFRSSLLIPEPDTVVPLKIDFSKTAKNIDVKKIKGKIFEKIKTESSQSQGTAVFSQLYKDLIREMPKKDSKELSVALSISCILQLANEKGLSLESQQDYNDILISTPISNLSLND